MELDLVVYLLTWPVVIAIALVMAAQMGWLVFRVFNAKLGWATNAGMLFGVTVIALLPPHEYADLDRKMICALLMLPLTIAAIVGDPPRFKFLPFGHFVFAILLFYVAFQAAR